MEGLLEGLLEGRGPHRPGYDPSMRSWGGENIDQSLRTWLCGGEIVYAEGSRVACLGTRSFILRNGWELGHEPKKTCTAMGVVLEWT